MSRKVRRAFVRALPAVMAMLPAVALIVDGAKRW